jgi:hypothetical protein
MSKRKWFFKRGNARLCWDTLPEWVQYVAINKSGQGFCFRFTPYYRSTTTGTYWLSNDCNTHCFIRTAICNTGCTCDDWRDLLFERPKPDFTEIALGVWTRGMDVEVCKPCKPVSPHISIVCHCGHTVEMTEADETSYLTYLAKCPDCGVTWEVTWSA